MPGPLRFPQEFASRLKRHRVATGPGTVVRLGRPSLAAEKQVQTKRSLRCVRRPRDRRGIEVSGKELSLHAIVRNQDVYNSQVQIGHQIGPLGPQCQT